MTSARDGKHTRYLLIGFPRSGTTLLSRLLDAHPEISCPPETFLMSAAARFLSEQTDVEGPPIGVLSGVQFLGVEPEEVMEPLREMVFSLHARFAGDAPIWVEKTAVDVFHLETLETFLGGHVRFILLTRNPLDVVASNMDLSNTMASPLADIWQRTREYCSPHEGIAHAWLERDQAMRAFASRNPEDCIELRYEDLTNNPTETLSELLGFMGLERDGEALAKAAEQATPRIGLGDFRVNESLSVRPAPPNGWRKRLPRMASARLIPILANAMEAHGYKVPKVPKIPSREDAVRQYVMAAKMKLSTASTKE